MTTSAVISDCGTYRYHLQRIWGDEPRVCWIMLNPSTADAEQDDPTIRRVINFSKAWGHGGIDVVNLFALRATKPIALYTHFEPIGGVNDEWITRIAGDRSVTRIVAAWGRGGEYRNRGQEVLKLLREYSVDVVGSSVYPRHPLYLKSDLQPMCYQVALRGHGERMSTMDIGKWLYDRKPDDQVFLRDEVSELLEALMRDLERLDDNAPKATDFLP